jgi:membrane associated rhomboid family serine protease
MSNSSLNNNVKLLAIICLIMAGVHAVNVFTNGVLLQFGIHPRDVYSLPNIFSAPFLHGSWVHLLNNLFGMAIFGALCLLRGRAFFIKSSVFIIVFTGLMVWAIGKTNTNHIGASGWIFGLWSLSIATAWFQRNFVNIVIAIFVIVFYGGMIYGVLPSGKAISFESHLAGAIGGVLYAWVKGRKVR